MVTAITRFFALVLLLTGIIGCGVTSYWYENKEFQEESLGGAVTLTPWKIAQLQGATARFEVIDDETDNYKWIGTAWALYQSKDKSVWITCKHVAAGYTETTRIVYRGKSDYFCFGSVEYVNLCDTSDIAVFLSDAKPRATLNLATDEFENSLRNYYNSPLDYATKPEIIFADAGHMGWAFPSTVTIGTFVGYSDLGIQSNVGAWYGYSGSALVDLKTMQVVGITYRFVMAIRTDGLVAVPASDVRKFLNGIAELK